MLSTFQDEKHLNCFENEVVIPWIVCESLFNFVTCQSAECEGTEREKYVVMLGHQLQICSYILTIQYNVLMYNNRKFIHKGIEL